MRNLLEVVLHPIRMRILMALAGREMTAQQISEALGDVPMATLYRHLGQLSGAGMLAVVDQRPVRGTLLKVYALTEHGGYLNPDELTEISGEEHLRFFTAFIASLIDDFSRYVNSGKRLDLLADGVGYRKFPLELSDEEFTAMTKAVNAAILPFLENEPAPERKRRIIATISLPDRPPAGVEKGDQPAYRRSNTQGDAPEESK